nr:hypothetical protein [Neisseriaceae bacterium]
VALPQWTAVAWGMTTAAVSATLPDRPFQLLFDERKDGGALVWATPYVLNGVSFSLQLSFFEDRLLSMRLRPEVAVQGQFAQMKRYFTAHYGQPYDGGGMDAAMGDDGRMLESVTWHSEGTGIGLADQSDAAQPFAYDITVFGRQVTYD